MTVSRHSNSNNLYLLVHTMTITENDLIVEAQFFHTFKNSFERMDDVRLICRRLRVHQRNNNNNTSDNRLKRNLLKLQQRPSFKKSVPKIKHHLRTIHISSGGGGGGQNQTNFRTELLSSSSSIDNNNPSPKCETQQPQQQQQQQHNGISSTPPVVVMVNERKIENDNELHDDQLVPYSTPQQTLDWLIRNRFEKYLQTFESFSGADMLRMSRDDLIQICGQADGIRLYNSLHLKAIAPKLKIYVCRENTPIFNAIFLSTHSYNELIMKLSNIMGINQEQVRDIYLEGPQSIHIQLNNDVIKHIKEETMFSIQILQENGGTFVFILKKTVK